MPVIARPQQPKPPRMAGQSSTPHEAEIRLLKDRITHLDAENKQFKAAKGMLTEAEKAMTKGELQAKWAAERREQRFGPPNQDFLTAEEKDLPRYILQRRLAAEANQRWANRQRALGVEMTSCPECSRMLRADDTSHYCFRPNWKFPVGRQAGVDRHQEIIVSNTGGGIRVGRQVAVDPAQLAKRIEYLQKVQSQLASAGNSQPTAEVKPESSAPQVIDLTGADSKDMQDDVQTMVITQLSPPQHPRAAPIILSNRFDPLFRDELEELGRRP